MLRKGRRAEVKFVGGRGILKALKTFAISHDHLSQHRSTVSFCPSFVRQVSVKNRTAGDAGEEERDGDGDGDGEDSASGNVLEFTCHAWMRPCLPKEIPLQSGRDERMLDFSLDCRREWKNKTSIAMDMAYNLADMLYGRLLHNEFPQPMIVSADMAQSTTIFLALALFQKRLSMDSGGQSVVMVTVFRNTALPRVDGRNGFIFAVKIHTNGAPIRPSMVMSHH